MYQGTFSVIGKEGFTNDREGVIQRLRNKANGRFAEIAHLAKRDEAGNISEILGDACWIHRR